MSDYMQKLAELEEMFEAHKQASERRSLELHKSLSHHRPLHPDFGQSTAHSRDPLIKALANRIQEGGIDLLKAETTLRALDRNGLLAPEESAEAWRRIRNLRPTQVIRL